MNKLLIAVLGGTVASSLLAAPALKEGSVKLSQDDARKIVVEYEIENEPAIVTAVFAEGGAPIDGCLTADVWGDVNKKVGVGAHKFYLDPTKVASDREVSAANMSVTLSAWATNCPPDYLVLDLCYTNIVKFYANTNSFPGGFGSDRYKTTELVMRRVPAADIEWRMGNPSWVKFERGGGLASNTNHYVTISSDYYMAVYELTVSQQDHAQLAAASKSESKMPKSGSYDAARGTSSTWPKDGHQVDGSSLIGRLRALTGLEIDLPTEAQWEYACRAGSQVILSFEYEWNMDDGHPGQFHGDSWNVGANAYPYAWFSGSSGNVSHEVGMLKPNKWGLYDMHGNVAEWCLDWYAVKTANPEYDPEGPLVGTKRILRGGYYNDSCTPGLSGARANDVPSYSSARYGYRLVCPMGEW